MAEEEEPAPAAKHKCAKCGWDQATKYRQMIAATDDTGRHACYTNNQCRAHINLGPFIPAHRKRAAADASADDEAGTTGRAVTKGAAKRLVPPIITEIFQIKGSRHTDVDFERPSSSTRLATLRGNDVDDTDEFLEYAVHGLFKESEQQKRGVPD